MKGPAPKHEMTLTKDGYRRNAGLSLDYGHICPACAGPKTRQALRCARCYADSLCTHGESRRGVLQRKSFESTPPFMFAPRGLGMGRWEKAA